MGRSSIAELSTPQVGMAWPGDLFDRSWLSWR
jgi:hypothetical protein